ncbi:hypothetical protein CN163_29825, partial [Sinorhizobium meliloti]
MRHAFRAFWREVWRDRHRLKIRADERQHERGDRHRAATVCGKLVGTVRNSVRWAMMMKRRESSHGYRERTSGPAPGW